MDNDNFLDKDISNYLEFESVLEKDLLPQVDSVINKSIPLKAFPSILDNPFSYLVKMDIDEIKKILIEEISSLENENNDRKDVQLQKIFTRLFSFQPGNELVDFKSSETRFYIDLISILELYQNKYIRDFLDKRFYVSTGDIIDSFKLSFLRKLYSYYDSHSKDACDKLNYILRSSNNVTFELVEDSTINLDDFFSDRIMSSFDKEELSQLFRFYFNSSRVDELTNLFSDEKSLKMISEMTKMVKNLTGHGSEFLQSVLNILRREDNFNEVLNSFYDEFNNKDLSSIVEVRELINYIISYSYDLASITGTDSIRDVESFMRVIKANRERSHYHIFERGTLRKINDGTFDIENDFKKIDNINDLDNFKKAILFNIYGIDFHNARVLVRQYGKYIDKLECVLEEDKVILDVLKTIKEIVDLDMPSPDFKEKLDILQVAYYDFVFEHGLDSKNSVASMLILEGLCSKMIMHTYNERLLSEDKCKVLEKDRGVTLIDAGVDFDIILTATNAVGNFFGDYENFFNKWNTAHLSENQGLCVSHITNQNTGVISFGSPFLGFSYVPDESLNTMGPYDIYSHVADFNLRRSNGKLNRLFVPASIMSDETRFGYNELLIDRFLMNDKKGDVKLQPSYVVFFKVGDTEDNRIIYNQSLKIAQDLDIPILVVDIPKIKKHEKEELEKMEEELFNNDSLDLLNPIITRYMNNYTGSLSLTGSGYGGYEEDFSVPLMRYLFKRLVEKVNSIEDEKIRREWMNSIVDVYKSEKDKYDNAKKVLLYEYSVESFILDDLGLGEVVKDILLGKDRLFVTDMVIDLEEKKSIPDEVDIDDIIYDDPDKFPGIQMSDGKVGTFFSKSNYTSSVEVITDFVNLVGYGSSFKVEEGLTYKDTLGTAIYMDIVEDTDLLLIENLSLVYFTEDLSMIPTVELQCLAIDNLAKFKLSSDFDFINEVKNSEYNNYLTTSGSVLTSNRIDKYIEKIESIPDDKFIQVFRPMINDLVKKENSSFEELSLKLLDKKHNMRDNFNKLKNVYSDTDNNDLNKGKR